ncbi:hypothetical protein [Candidatus Methylocalor cossyra]|uniref:Uncharacterized protein n=1 Tax=Candidatus Methylocalor cossyra TaxID=3108543 RepID=A0ABP1C4U7_9GAMM
MATKTDFSAQDWQVLRETPQLVAIAVAAAGSSGLIGSVLEAIAPVRPILDALQGNHPLLREVCQREEVQASLEAVKARVKGQDFETVRTTLREAALEHARRAREILQAKGLAEDADAYGKFLRDLGQRVAKAAAEGSFLGFGGERVSEPERTLLAELDRSLGIPAQGAA